MLNRSDSPIMRREPPRPEVDPDFDQGEDGIDIDPPTLYGPDASPEITVFAMARSEEEALRLAVDWDCGRLVSDNVTIDGLTIIALQASARQEG